MDILIEYATFRYDTVEVENGLKRLKCSPYQFVVHHVAFVNVNSKRVRAALSCSTVDIGVRAIHPLTNTTCFCEKLGSGLYT